MKKLSKIPLSIALGSTAILGMMQCPILEAGSLSEQNTSPFAMNELESGYMQFGNTQNSKARAKEIINEGKCGEGKCGSGLLDAEPIDTEPESEPIAIVTDNRVKVGKKIYDRAFGRGCGACHDISSNPQLVPLIQTGELDYQWFSDVLKNGNQGMPKAMDAIMAVGPVKQAGYTEDQAIEALFLYLGGVGQDVPSEVITEVEHVISLNSDFSFNIPALKYVDADGVANYYNIDFIFSPMGTKILFEPAIQSFCTENDFQCLGLLQENAEIALNQELGFIIPVLRYTDSNGLAHDYQVGFAITFVGNTLLFEVTSIEELE